MQRGRKGGLIGLGLAALLLGLAGCGRPAVVEEEAVVPEETAVVVQGAEEVTEPVKIEMPDPEEDEGFVLDKRSQVSMLLYHDVSTSASSNPMKIPLEKFRTQMQTLKDSEIPVISLSDFMKWKRGEANVPEFCVLISFDDGWREVYTMAFPILKEMEFPFSLFLYTKYLNIGGRSLTYDQVNEMIAAGAEIGSHSVSHLDLTKRHGLTEEGYQEFLVRELKESRDELKEKFGDAFVDVFSYPFGTYSEEISKLGLKLGYELLLTVDGRKNSWDTPNAEIGRYIIHGNNDGNFTYALTYRGNTNLAGGSRLLEPAKGEEESMVKTWPAPEETIAERQPLIEVDLSKLEGVDPQSVRMAISGWGTVPAEFNGTTGKLSYRLPQRLRNRQCMVSVRLKRAGEPAEDVIAWTFYVDLVKHYLGTGEGAEGASGEKAEAAEAREAASLLRGS